MLKTLRINGIKRKYIEAGSKPYVIAEIGSNHNQDFELACKLIEISAECGADAVKFQSLNLNKQYASVVQTKELSELFSQIKLEEAWYKELANKANSVGVDFFSAPTYLESIELLERVGVPYYKVASPQLRTFPSLIKRVAKLGKPLLISVGYCTYAQIEYGVNLCLEQGNDQFLLLHCVSEYPTEFGKVNLNSMNTFSKMFDCMVGVSDHTPGYEVPCAAVALGAVVIEKHITLDRSLPGPDHNFAMEPREFREMVCAVHNVHQALGLSKKVVTCHESSFAQKILVRWYANTDIAKGDIIDARQIRWLRSNEGISDEHCSSLGHIRAKRAIAQNMPINWADVEKI